MFTVKFKNNASFNLDNIVDYYTGKNVLGKDIDRKLTFENNDLKTVEFEDAIEQSFYIKINAKKNSIPQFPDKGIDANIIGTNVASLTYPALFRDLLNLFNQDQRWSEVNILDINRVDSSVFIKLEAKTITKDAIISNVNIW